MLKQKPDLIETAAWMRNLAEVPKGEALPDPSFNLAQSTIS
ncbi:MAG: hypothetical protein ACRD1R_08810 [Acidobacteriota bacterium]